jgi:hypothetical protein
VTVLSSATSIPAGTYVVQATISANHNQTPGNWQCTVTIGGNAVVSNSANPGTFQTLGLVGGITLAAAGTPLIQCQSTTAGAVVVNDVAFSAVQVTTRTALP